MDAPMTIRALATDAEIMTAFPVMVQLRDHLRAETFLADVRAQERDGYRLFAAFAADQIVALAGVRPARTLFRGPHLFIDDLVTTEPARGQGHGTALLAWLARHALSLGYPKIYLDSRSTARGFYEKIGFTMMTSIPCWIDAAKLAEM